MFSERTYQLCLKGSLVIIMSIGCQYKYDNLISIDHINKTMFMSN